jgi:hypothetical protein
MESELLEEGKVVVLIGFVCDEGGGVGSFGRGVSFPLDVLLADMAERGVSGFLVTGATSMVAGTLVVVAAPETGTLLVDADLGGFGASLGFSNRLRSLTVKLFLPKGDAGPLEIILGTSMVLWSRAILLDFLEVC